MRRVNRLLRLSTSALLASCAALIFSAQGAFAATVDDSALNAEITAAQNFAAYAVVGSAQGDCSQSDLNALTSAISSAQSVADDTTASQATVDAAVTALTNAIQTFEATGVNLVPNPGFETGALDPWTTQNNATVEPDNAHAGTYAVNLGGPASGVQQTITGLAPNTTYTLTAWVKTAGDVVYLGAENFAGAGSQVNTTTTAAGYTQLKVSFTTDSTSTSVYIFLWKNDNTGPAYADDFSLRDAPPYSTQKYNGQDIGFNTQDPYFESSTQLNQLYDQVAATGTKWVRATLFWDLMEPTKGKIDWTQADMIFNAIKAHGFKYDMVIRSAPSWAANGADTSNHNYAPTDSTSYGEFCYQVAKRYLNRGVTIVFELGNEENTQFFNEPAVDPVAYTKDMLIPGSTGIGQAAKELGVPKPTVLVGGFAPVDPQNTPGSVSPLDFLQAIYDNGGKGYFDSIAYHPYTYVSAPDSTNWTFTELQSLVNLMDSEGDTNRKVYATEVGWATGTGTGEISEADQATYTGEEFDEWFSLPYAGPMIWYELVDNSSNDNTNRENTFGLMYNTNPWTPKPAYNIFESKVAPVDVTALNSAITSAKSIAQHAVVGTGYGDYAQTNLDELNAAITTAQAAETAPTADQAVIDTAVTTLNNAVTSFQSTAVQDHTPPTIEITSPTNKRYLDDQTLTIRYRVNDNLSGVNNALMVAKLDGRSVKSGDTILLYTLPLGAHTMRVTAVDNAGNKATQTVSFTTTTNMASIQQLVQTFQQTHAIDNGGIANGLEKKLSHDDLNSFVNEVQAQSGKHIQETAAAVLIRDAQSLRTS
ncbi:carbohydrate binding domain-containing protein [Alicyclobacillus fodiniaquatilis]|uniref:Carbohydrate binding domain-containing protein n=1 Tax=Alicyclobacillus fodiniaquatilis TaxID=1661150 RepID=A0ABW4JS53_9BACL